MKAVLGGGCHVAILCSLTLGLGPRDATAQASLALDGRVGPVFPVADMADVTDPGLSGGVAATFFLTERVGMRAALDAAFFNDQTDAFGIVPAPPLTFISLEAGFELDIPPPRYQGFPLSGRLRVGAGGTWVRGSEEYVDGSSVDIDEIRPSVAGGFAVGYRPSGRVEVFVDGAVRLVFLSEEITGLFAARSRQVAAFERAWFVPLTLGLRIQ